MPRCCMVVVENNTSVCDLIDVWRVNLRGAMKSNIIEAQVICQDEDDIGR